MTSIFYPRPTGVIRAGIELRDHQYKNNSFGLTLFAKFLFITFII